jgi:hypothetical protein
MFPRPGRKAAESAERSPAPDARPDGELEGSARAHRAARERSRPLLRPALILVDARPASRRLPAKHTPAVDQRPALGTFVSRDIEIASSLRSSQ